MTRLITSRVWMLCLTMLLGGCSDLWMFDQESKTLAGSVTSMETYAFNGVFDDIPVIFSMNTPRFLLISKKTANSIILDIGMNPNAPLSGDIVSLSTSELQLSGQAGNVFFDGECAVYFVPGDAVTNGTITGWLTRKPNTKTSPDQPDLEGHIKITWCLEDNSFARHSFEITKIIGRKDFAAYQ